MTRPTLRKTALFGTWIGGATYGYFMGGFTTFNATASAVAYRLTFSTDTIAANTASNLSVARMWAGSVSDKYLYGYIAGGNTSATSSGVAVATADRITFGTGTTSANTASNLSAPRIGIGCVSDGRAFGYFLGGDSSGAPALVVTSDKITFSTGTTAASTVSNLPTARGRGSSVSDSGTYGYSSGGYTQTAAVVLTDRITFSTATTAAYTTGNLPTAVDGPSGMSDNVTYGYSTGGYTGAYTAATNRLTFSTGTYAGNTASNLSAARGGVTSCSSGTTHGYWSGGLTGTTLFTTTDKITFSTSATAAATTANLPAARYYGAGLSDYAV